MCTYSEGCKTKGRFISKTPSGAARKAARYCEGEPCFLVVKETTRGSNKKEYMYRVTIDSMERTVTLNGKTVTFRKTIKVHKA